MTGRDAAKDLDSVPRVKVPFPKIVERSRCTRLGGWSPVEDPNFLEEEERLVQGRDAFLRCSESWIQS